MGIFVERGTVVVDHNHDIGLWQAGRVRLVVSLEYPLAVHFATTNPWPTRDNPEYLDIQWDATGAT
jgi:hypothetical protein